MLAETNWGEFWGGAISFLTAVGVLAGLLFQLYEKWMSIGRHAKEEQVLSSVAASVEDVKHQTNALKDELVTATKIVAKANGVTEERERHKSEELSAALLAKTEAEALARGAAEALAKASQPPKLSEGPNSSVT